MINNKIKLYLSAILLFLMSFLLASTIISNIKIGEFHYPKILLYAAIVVFAIWQIIHLAKIENKPK